MKTVHLSLDPPEVFIEDVEDFLATDDLFVEYFNKFLTLPTFPEPLCFNKETGGFEVVTNARKELAQQIKSAIRSQKRTPRIYRAVKKHSYIDIPLIPMEVPDGPENLEINTSFTVTTLNKEQGIHWIKAERLPAFLESDLYLEYRLSRLLSQARLTGDDGEYVLMKIDYKPKVKKVRKVEEEAPVEDPKEILMKDLYVCMGNAGSTETEAWFSTARMVQGMEPTYSSVTRPSSRPQSERPRPQMRPTSARPASALTYSKSESYARSDSGMGSSAKDSVKGSSYGNLYQSKFSVMEDDGEDDIFMSKLFSSDGRPITPRLSGSVCHVAKDQIRSPRARPMSATVYSYPKIELHHKIEAIDDTESGLDLSGEGEKDDLDSSASDKQEASIEESQGQEEEEKSYVIKNIDDVGAVIVGVVIKHTVKVLTGKSDEEIETMSEIQNIFPDKSFTSLTLDSLDKISFTEQLESLSDTIEQKDEADGKIDQKKKKEEESDVDSLLDSEDDYEEADLFFRKHKHKTFSLTNCKGIGHFKNFLAGTLGEKYWNLWVDIDKMKLMTKPGEIQNHLNNLREKYHRPGATQELPNEQKVNFGLVEPTSWTLDKMFAIQNQIAEPLLLYWAPRFLLKQNLRTNPDRSPDYQQQKLLKSVNGAYPNPPTASLLPLRPKSCVPRIKQSATISELEVPDIKVESSVEMETFETSPPVGMKRTYAPPTIEFLANWKKSQEAARKELISPHLTVARSSTPKHRTPSSAKSSPTLSPRPRSTRPASAVSTSSQGSVESATGRVRIRTPQLHSRSPRDRKESKHDQKKDGGKPRSRPSSAASSISTISRSEDTEVSEFLGGGRMEALLQALFHENEAGGFFRRYVEKSGNRVWINNLTFWHELQEYHFMFYAKSLDLFGISKKAKAIFSQYVVYGAPHPINCSKEMADAIYARIDPPYEELFDVAEEYSISVLYVSWVQMQEVDQKTYQKVELIEVKRHLETKSKYVLHLQKRGLIKERVLTPDDPMEGYEDPVYDHALLENIPEEFKDYTLEKLVHNRIELEFFRQFLADNYADMDLKCWMDIESFRRITHTEEKKWDAKAKEIKKLYLNKKYFFGPNSPAGKEGQDKVMEAGGGWGKLLDDRPPNAVILEAQKYVRERLEKKWLPLFLATPDFAVRQKPRTSMDDVVDDVLVQRRKKSQAVLRLLESRWVSSSKEIIIFRQALLNPVTALQFRRYVSIKGDTLENDVLFWLEVQKFKDLNHAHSDDSLIQQKVSTIISCFIESQIPPSLQIDIPQDMADGIIDRKKERSPYLFREAQLTVFRILFSHWEDFCKFRSNLAEEKIMPTIERRRKHAKLKEKQRQQEMEERQARREKEQERRAAMGLPALTDDDAFHDPFQTGEGSVGEDEEETELKGDKRSWSYSKHMEALEREELLNNTDETSFSSLLTDTESVKESAREEEKDSNNSRNEEEKAQKKVPTADGETQTEKRKSVKINGKKADENGTGPAKKKSKDGSLGRRSSQDSSLISSQQRSKVGDQSKTVTNGKKATAEVKIERQMPPISKKK